MDVVLMILYSIIVLGVLVVIHEGGHFLAARAFHVRVTEFMVGLPSPSVGVWRKGTRFGLTAVPLGGYARVCGMESGEESPHLAQVVDMVFRRGELNMEDVESELGLSEDDAYHALDELAEWGTIRGPMRSDKYNTYRTPSSQQAGIEGDYAEGQPRPVPGGDAKAFIDEERAHQYRSLPFRKRIAILLVGPMVNLLFALVVFVIVYSVIGIDYVNQAGEAVHIHVDPLRSIVAGMSYIGTVTMAVLQLFNPATAAQTVSNSASVVGVAVLSKTAADQGLISFCMFTAMISVSLGIMNMLPIPPLDGGKFVVEVYQRIRRRWVSQRAVNALSMAGMAAFTLLFVVMLNQDIQRFIFGNW